MKMPPIVPITDFRQDAARALDQVRKSSTPVVITQRGRAAAVMQSVEAYEKGERERQLLRILAMGEQEIAAGKGRNLDLILADLDRALRAAGA